MASSFRIISSLRYDPALPNAIAQCAAHSYPDPLRTPYYLLPYHQDRLINAARHFNWHHALSFLEQDLSTFVSLLDCFISDRAKPWRLRVVVEDKPTARGGFVVEVNPTASIEPSQLLLPSEGSVHKPAESLWRVYVDTQPIVPSAFTTHKTTAREYYTAARERAGIKLSQEQAEVLVVNPAGEVMEGSITTPYFRWRSGTASDDDKTSPEWITPPLSCGGNAGTTRRYALAQGFCTEQVISTSELVDGEECWLSNGVRGFMRGIVVLEGRSEVRI